MTFPNSDGKKFFIVLFFYRSLSEGQLWNKKFPWSGPRNSTFQTAWIWFIWNKNIIIYSILNRWKPSFKQNYFVPAIFEIYASIKINRRRNHLHDITIEWRRTWMNNTEHGIGKKKQSIPWMLMWIFTINPVYDRRS